MGGPMSVNDEGEHPWLREEKRLIASAARGGVPVWGACLGVQLLASALAATVYTGSEPEVGLLPVTLTEEGRVDPFSEPCRPR
jgi:GMP synthase-like glutamine amidotransferase